jgi:hypothetical protein
MEKVREDGRLAASGDRATGLRPQPASRSSQSSVPDAAHTQELLQALEKVTRRLSAVGEIGRDDAVLAEARAAIAKAGGRL